MLKRMALEEFIEEVGSSSPAPGGGSVAALCGALGAALSSMVCRLTVGKKGYEEQEENVKALMARAEEEKRNLIRLIDEDTEAFKKVMAAFKMPKENEEQKEERRRAIQEAMKTAALVPLEVMERGINLLEIAKNVAEKGNKNSITDAGVAALTAKCAVLSAGLNVRINLSSIKDEEFVQSMKKRVADMESTAERLTDETINIVSLQL